MPRANPDCGQPPPDPRPGWFAHGARVGAAVGALLGLAVTVWCLVEPKGDIGSALAIGLALVSGGWFWGGVTAVLWLSLLRPIVLAVFCPPERFVREYGTPEGIDRKDPPRP